MMRGASFRIDDITDGIITTSAGDRYRLADPPNVHIEKKHRDPRVGDVAFAAIDSSPDVGALTLVTIQGGCDCRLGVYLESRGARSN